MANKTVEEHYELYGGEVKLRFLPNSHRYYIDEDMKLGVTGVTGVINKEALMLYPLEEAITHLERTLIKPIGEAKQTIMYSRSELQSIIDSAKGAWRAKNLRGTDAGTFGHDWLERYLTAVKEGTPLPAPIEKIDLKQFGEDPDKGADEYIRATDNNHIVDAIDQFLSFMKNHKVDILHVEKICYSRQFDYCGKFDAILRIDGKVYLIDFKTSNPSREFLDGIYPENFAQLGGYDIAFTEEFPDFHIDGHAVFNLSKKTGKLAIQKVEGEKERQENRDFFLFALGTKRGMQNRTRLLSSKNKDRKGVKK